MHSVLGILKQKGREVWSIHPQDTVLSALQIMADKGVGSVVVVEEERVVGVFSERDYARKGILKGRASADTRVEEIMTREVVSVSPSHLVTDCLALVTKERVRHLPVLDEGRLVGLVSIGDLVKVVIDDQRFIIERLEDYVRG